jgi:hypothetical protein
MVLHTLMWDGVTYVDGNHSPRQQFVHACSGLPRLQRNAIAAVSTAMISALLVTAVPAQQTQPKPQQARPRFVLGLSSARIVRTAPNKNERDRLHAACPLIR